MVRAILHVEPMEMKIETFTGRIHSADRFSDGCTELFALIPFFFFFFFFFRDKLRDLTRMEYKSMRINAKPEFAAIWPADRPLLACRLSNTRMEHASLCIYAHQESRWNPE